MATHAYKTFPLALATAFVLLLSACSKEAKEPEPEVSVQVAPVEQTTLQHTVSAEATLFPLEQAAITPKISAPVKKFLVKRGSRVHAGQLLAVLEKQDFAAAATHKRGAPEQAPAPHPTTNGAGPPEKLQKTKRDIEGAQKKREPEKKVY